MVRNCNFVVRNGNGTKWLWYEMTCFSIIKEGGGVMVFNTTFNNFQLYHMSVRFIGSHQGGRSLISLRLGYRRNFLSISTSEHFFGILISTRLVDHGFKPCQLNSKTIKLVFTDPPLSMHH
jgi:hypothetical protein